MRELVKTYPGSVLVLVIPDCVLCHNVDVGCIRFVLAFRFRRLANIHQILDIAFRSPDRRIGKTQNFKSQSGCHSGDVPHDFFVHLFVPDNAFFANFVSAGLKLGLDQAHHFAAGRQDGVGGRQYFVKAYERDVDRCKGGRRPFSQILGLYIAEVGLLHTDDARVAPQFPVQLAISHVDGIDLACTVLQHAVRKAAGRSADIHADSIAKVNGKYLERLFKLESPAAHIAERGASDFDLCFFGVKTRPGLIFFVLIDIYDACHDQGFGLLS